MLKQLRTSIADWLWRKNYCERPVNYCNIEAAPITSPEQALTLSPVYAALDLYKRTLSTLPLVTYKRQEQGRERARTHPAYKVLHDRVNPSMSPISFFEILVNDYFMHGEFFALIQWKNNNNLNALFPIPVNQVLEVSRDEEWNKIYKIRFADGIQEIKDVDIIHITKDSLDGLRGRSIIDFAYANLGLHKQVQDSAHAYYKNAAKPSVYVTGDFGNREATIQAEQSFNDKYSGTNNAGKAPFVKSGTTINAFPNTTAEEAQVIQILASSVADTSRWFGVSPLTLSDLTRGTYSNLSADNEAFYQRSLRPLLVKVESEINYKLFGTDANVYSEFLTSAILRGSPEQQQIIFNGYITSGVMTKAEVREQLDLPFLPTTDILTTPVNQAVVTGQADAAPLAPASPPEGEPA